MLIVSNVLTGDIAMHSTILTFSANSGNTRCIEIYTLQDNVIESDESFSVELSLLNDLPTSVGHYFEWGSRNLTVTIQDTSKLH